MTQLTLLFTFKPIIMSADKENKSEELNESQLDNVAGGAAVPGSEEYNDQAFEEGKAEGEIDPTKPVEDFGPDGMSGDGRE